MIIKGNCMLDNIKKLLKDNQYKEANKQLVDLIKETDKNSELYSQAIYLRGRLNTDFHYKDKSDFIAKQSFLDCIQSQYPLPQREYYFEGVDRIQKRHIAILVKAFKDYPKELKIGKYLFSAQVKLNLRYDAYLTAIEMYKSESTFLNHICFESILDKIEDYDLYNIINDLLNTKC